MSDAVSGAQQSVEPTALQELLEQGAGTEAFAFAWLDIQCRQIEAAQAGVVLLREDESIVPVAKWPLTARVNTLAEAALAVVEDQCGLVLDLEQGSALAHPIYLAGELAGVAAIHVRSTDAEMMHSAMGQLQWSVTWFELHHVLSDSRNVRADDQRAQRAMRMLNLVQSQGDFQGAAMQLVTELASRFGCERVSLGMVARSHARLRAVSNTTKLSPRLAANRQITDAMDEAMALGDLVHVGTDVSELYPDHKHLLAESDGSHVLTLPVYVRDRYVCALCFERNHPFSLEEQIEAQAIGALTAPALADKDFRSRGWLNRAGQALGNAAAGLLGPGHLLGKSVTVLLAGLLLFMAFATGEYRVTADAVLEGETQRVVAAPFSGYIEEALVIAGEVVAAGDVLCRLDDADLRLDRENWLSQRSQYRRQYDQAFAELNSVEVAVAEARVAQAEAQLALVENKLERSVMRAPFDGIVIEGDLRQQLGSYVEKGDTLFVVAPLQTYRVVLLIDEAQIGDVREAQSGELVLTSQPDATWPVVVEHITPVTDAADGVHRFRVEANLEIEAAALGELRPGMAGVAKLGAGERSLLWIWTRELIHWVRITWWRWWP